MHFHFTKISTTKPPNSQKMEVTSAYFSRRVLHRSFKTQVLMQTLPVMATCKDFFLRQCQVYWQLKKKPKPNTFKDTPFILLLFSVYHAESNKLLWTHRQNSAKVSKVELQQFQSFLLFRKLIISVPKAFCTVLYKRTFPPFQFVSSSKHHQGLSSSRDQL